MDQIHDSVAWYQKKIGLHDKQLWEQSVDRKVLKGIRNAPRRSVRAKTELIDVDLIRGSTFTRAKPQVSWTYIVHKAISRVLFFPFHYKWWLQQTSSKFFVFLLILYILQVLATVVFCQNFGAILVQDELTLSEVFIPIALMLLLGYIHSQTVLSQSHVSHRSHRDIKSIRQYQARKKSEQRKKFTPAQNLGCDKSTRNSTNLSQEGDRKSPNVDRRPKRVVKSKDFIVKPSKSGGLESKTVSWSDSYHEENKKSVSCDRIKKQESQDSEISTEDENCCKHRDSTESEQETAVKHKKNLYVDADERKLSRNIHSDSSQKSNSLIDVNQQKKNHIDSDQINGCHDNTAKTNNIDILSSDKHISDKNVEQLCDGLTVPKFVDGTILHTEDLCEEETEKFNIKPMYESLSSISSSNSTLDSNNLENHDKVQDKKDKNNSDETLDNFIGIKNHVENVGVSRNLREQLNFVRHGENFSEDSGIDFTHKTFLSRSSSLPLTKTPHHKPKKEVTSDTDPERNNSGSESENESKIKAKVAVLQGLRRRKNNTGDESSESGPSYRSKRTLTRNKDSFMKDLSSSEGETSQASGHKTTISSEEWEDRVHTDDTTSTYSSSSGSDVDLVNDPGQESSSSLLTSSSANHPPGESQMHVINLLQPGTSEPTSSSNLGHHYVPPDKVSCVIWESGECQKVELTALELGWTIIEKVDDIPESSDYILIGLMFSVLLCLTPVLFRIYHIKELPSYVIMDVLWKVVSYLMNNSWRLNLIMFNGIIQRFWLGTIFFFLLSVSHRTFKQRLLYAKHFCYLTSARRARKFDMPHFRLNKVRNIKTWLSIRSYLKKRGPQRSVDVIVSACFLITIVLITLMCLQLLKDTESYVDFLCNWELLFWSMAFGVYLFRFLTLGLKINKKYRNLSVLITEQINLYLQMEQKPHKKEELMVANNVLKLAEDLLKELESPFKVSGLTANPVIYNITRVVVLSAFSAVLTELLGFKLKLYKIKLKT